MIHPIAKKGFTPLEIYEVLKRWARSIPQLSFVSLGSFRSASRTGFTLIELLVVMAIIGLLASIVLVSFSTARAKARDSRRVIDLKQMLNAIAQLGDSVDFQGCTGAGAKKASACQSNPNLAALFDPLGTTVCGAGGANWNTAAGLTAACDYRVNKRSADGTPKSNDYAICAYLEQGSNILTAGAVRITDASNNGIEQGGCQF